MTIWLKSRGVYLDLDSTVAQEAQIQEGLKLHSSRLQNGEFNKDKKPQE